MEFASAQPAECSSRSADLRRMIRPMQQMAPTQPSPSPSSFASMLADLAAAAPTPTSTWNEDGLADDVATLSYERALRTHARYNSADSAAGAFTANAEARPAASHPAPQAAAPSSKHFSKPQPVSPSGAAIPETSHGQAPASDRTLKSASITIRLSQDECDQVRQRAAEAGLTVSAYLRSCTLEVEALRMQVKEALTQFRSAASAAEAPAAGGHAGPRWLRRLWNRQSS